FQELLDDLPCLNLPVPLLGLSKAADAAATPPCKRGRQRDRELLRRLPGRRSRQSSGDACAAAAKLMADEPPPWWMRDIGAVVTTPAGKNDEDPVLLDESFCPIKRKPAPETPKAPLSEKNSRRKKKVAAVRAEAKVKAEPGVKANRGVKAEPGVKAEDKENSGNNRRVSLRLALANSLQNY
uniref:BLVR domain-containing protein n=1 Tax=Macrostomum lignano TaxID=282301 RepID=A0A1I8IP18_9PLAT